MVHCSGMTTTHSLHCPQNVFNVYVNTAVAVILLPTSSLSLSQILSPLGKEKKMVFKSPSTKTNWVTKVKIALETTGLNQACLSQGLGNHNVSFYFQAQGDRCRQQLWDANSGRCQLYRSYKCTLMSELYFYYVK